MAHYRKFIKNKKYLNHFFMIGLFLLLHTMTLMSAFQIRSTPPSVSNEMGCPDSMRCVIKGRYRNSDEINAAAVDPLAERRTAVTIAFRNREIFAEKRKRRTVKVTTTVSAGMKCTETRGSGTVTINCTTSPSEKHANEAPKVDVARPTCGAPGPVLDADLRISGLVSGGTAVSVRGRHFVEPCTASPARLFVVLRDGAVQFASSHCDRPVNDTYMVCRSPRVSSGGTGRADWTVGGGRLLDFGLNVMDFAGGDQSLSVDGPSLGYRVRPDPVLVDFETDARGSVIVNGHHLQDVQPDDVVVRFPDLSAVGCAVVSVTQHIVVVCEPTASVAESRAISVAIGDSPEYTVFKRASLRPDGPSAPTNYCRCLAMAVLSALLVTCVCVSTRCCLRTKNRYDVSKTISNPPVAYAGSQDLHEPTVVV